ncbi:MAG: urease accessory protein UreD [Kangiellaceae bacterium]|nr:urease accessory protein UreD [Kangiellaceae bacterium]|tara:strand:- start:94 stop:1008 length:915 start_codon:yes stop_codon:yes gene_type:complete
MSATPLYSVHKATEHDSTEHYGTSRRWQASLELSFDKPSSGNHGSSNRTRMARMKFHGPLRVQRPFYPEGSPCHVYLLHPPGGMVSGDRLAIKSSHHDGSHALITTPAAGKIYRADSWNGVQRQKVALNIGNAICEWLPQENIIFNGANADLYTRIETTSDSKMIGWELTCLGRPSNEERFTEGSLVQRLEVYCDQTPLLLERQHLASNDGSLDNLASYASYPVTGTLVAGIFDSAPEALLEQLRALPEPEGSRAGVTWRNRLLIIRIVADKTERCRQYFIDCWGLVRQHLLAIAPSPPRIWFT